MSEPFAIFFPPRIIFPDLSVGDTNDIMDDASMKYMEKTICLIMDEQSLKDAQKIVDYAKAFPDVNELPSTAVPG